MRTIGDFNFAINFEPTSQKILDSRLKVSTKDDLTTAYPNNNYYPKMVVTVEDENALYMLTGDDPTDISNWTKLVAGDDVTVSVENSLTSSSTSNALSAAMGKKLNDEKVSKTTTINGKPLSSNIELTSSDIDGVATLNLNGKIPTSQLPSYVDDILEFDNVVDSGSFATVQGSISPQRIYYIKSVNQFAASDSIMTELNPTNLHGSWQENDKYRDSAAYGSASESGQGIIPQTGVIYFCKNENKIYRWSGSELVEIGESLALGETSSTAYAGDKGAQNADNISKLTDIVIGTNGGVITDSLVVTTDPENKYSEYEYITIGYGVANSTHPNNNPELKYIHIPAASTTKAGCMTVSDKNNITNIINSLTWQTIE